MDLSDPMGEANKGCLIIIGILLAVLVLVGAGVEWFVILPNSNKTTPTPVSAFQTPVGIGVTPVSGNQQIGISDGRFAFDVASDRLDADPKRQASAKFQQGDTVGANRLWQQAASKDTSDAEVRIYLEDEMVRESSDQYVTLVIATMLTGDASHVRAGRDNLQGAYVAQKEYNDGRKLGGVRVLLLIANGGDQASNATTVTKQIVQVAKLNPQLHVLGVMGWPYSSYTQNALDILKNASIPMVSQSASSVKLTGKSPFFFRIVPSDTSQAIAGAHYAEQQLHSRTAALFVDPKDPYSSSLADEFKQQFVVTDGMKIVDTEQYTVNDQHQQDVLSTLLNKALQARPDLIYFSGYSSDMGVLLADLPASANVQIMGGDALYGLGGYTSSDRAGFNRLHFTAFAYPDEWGYLKLAQPNFFGNYGQAFGPAPANVSPYGYTRADSDAILAYDATITLLEGCKIALTGKTSTTPTGLQQGLTQLHGSANAVQGVSGQISFGPDNDPINKAVVVLFVDPNTGTIQLANGDGAIQRPECLVIGPCSNP